MPYGLGDSLAGALSLTAVPPANPITGLRQVAVEIDRFATVLAAETDLDTAVLRDWHRRLLEIAAELDQVTRPRAPA